MPSLVQGFEYDIFISYRQKDNRYDGWVTEFVQNLRKELDATLKTKSRSMVLAHLRKWESERVQLNIRIGFIQPFQLLLKDHPLLDPLRTMPGFEELWDGNHLQVKPLELPKEWR